MKHTTSEQEGHGFEPKGLRIWGLMVWSLYVLTHNCMGFSPSSKNMHSQVETLNCLIMSVPSNGLMNSPLYLTFALCKCLILNVVPIAGVGFLPKANNMHDYADGLENCLGCILISYPGITWKRLQQIPAANLGNYMKIKTFVAKQQLAHVQLTICK